MLEIAASRPDLFFQDMRPMSCYSFFHLVEKTYNSLRMHGLKYQKLVCVMKR